ncbi:hypothetical protein HF086_012369 [Spodoptera exigua]|uniref:DUF5641 domain-containing protein n=1 Tax=Spodoptera exigua TaxID=7107 RepID=A0A922M8X3_SPOEX|nr:hypothetical protein HF086_012369 [Spodoptera exigua]
MFHTPKNMVNTRRTAKKDEEQMEVQPSIQKVPALPTNEEQQPNEDILRRDKTFLFLKSKPEGSVVKSEPPLTATQMIPSTSLQVPKAKSQRSSSSSVIARKKRLELEAAQAKAKIEIDLIEKQLAANLAEIDDECSVQSDHTNKDVEEWLERSHRELEAEPVRDRGQMKDVRCSPAAQNAGTNDGTVHLLASALRDFAAASTSNNFNTNLLSRICTPKDLPLFSGDPMEWLHFKQAYEESSKVCNFKDNENMWRLRKCLKGAAREAVSALLISATSPETVMSTLELQFGNPDIILSRILLDIKKLQPVSQDYHKDIVPFSIKVRNCVAAVKVIGQDEYLNGISITTSILSKLPPILISKWADYSYAWTQQGKRPTWFDISEFLNQEATKVSSLALLNKKKYTEGTVLFNKSIDNNEKCQFCRITKHKLYECKKFRKALRKDRWSFVKRNRLCYKCIDAKHDRATCPAAACDVDSCGQAHHKLLHYNSRETVNSDGQCVSSNPESSLIVPESETIAHIKNSECKVLLKVVPVRLHGPNGIFTTSALLDDGSTISLISASLAARAGLRGRRESLQVRGAWDNSSLVCDTDVISVCLANCNGEKFNISVRSMQNFSLPMQNYNVIDFNNYTHLCNMKNKFVLTNTKPEILIGQDNYNLLLPLEIKAAIPDPMRFSSWIRLLRATAMVLKFIYRCQRKEIDDCSLMKRAETLLLRYAQQVSFGNDIKLIKGSKCLDKNSRLRTLTPFLDVQDILRVGGRIDAAADVSFDVKHPAILDGKCQIAKLIVKYYHVKAGHGNQEMVRLADMFWRRWVTEVLPEMIPRQRWTQDQARPIQLGDLVFIVDPNAPRNVWPRGIIDKVFPGKDGRVRVVQVRTQVGTVKRSVARVARIPMDN